MLTMQQADTLRPTRVPIMPVNGMEEEDKEDILKTIQESIALLRKAAALAKDCGAFRLSHKLYGKALKLSDVHEEVSAHNPRRIP